AGKAMLWNYLSVKAARLEAAARLLQAKNPELKPNAPELRKLLLEWRDTLREEKKAFYAWIEGGRATLDSGQEWGGTDHGYSVPRGSFKSVFLRLLEAELALAEKDVDRVKAHEAFLEIMKRSETINKSSYDRGNLDPWKFYASKAARLEAKIWLLRAKAPVAKQDSPQIKVLLKEWRDVLRNEMAILNQLVTMKGMTHSPLLLVAARVLVAELALTSKPSE